jgi:hypothetical protein
MLVDTTRNELICDHFLATVGETNIIKEQHWPEHKFVEDVRKLKMHVVLFPKFRH